MIDVGWHGTAFVGTVSEISLAGVAGVITATALLVGAIAGAWATIKSARTIQATHAMVKQVDKAVNGKPPGETTMVQQVQDLTDAQFPKPDPADPGAILPTLHRIEVLLTEVVKERGTA